MTSQSLRLPLAVLLACLALCTISSCASDGEYHPAPEAEKDVDAIRDEIDVLLETGAELYDKGDFTNAYISARRAFDMSVEIQEDDLQAHMIMGWSLLQLRAFEGFQYQGRTQQGAREIFEEILSGSPNEFKARLGVATIAFNQHFISNRKAKVFGEIGRELKGYQGELEKLVANLGKSGSQRSTLLELERKWSFDRGFVSLYRQAYARPEGLWDDHSIPERLVSGPDYPGWTRENFIVDQVTYSLREGYIDDAKKQMAQLEGWCAIRKTYWEERSLEFLNSALAGFKDLERTGGNIYYVIHRDIGLTHMAAGSYFMSKGLELARREIVKTEEWKKVPEFEQESVLRSYYNDPVLHKVNPWRASANEEFRMALDSLETYVREDKRYELEVEKRVSAKSQDFSQLTNVDAIQSEFIGLWQGAYAGELNTLRGQRKSILLQMISVLIKPEYGNRDYARAEAFARELSLADINDSLNHMVRGHILELQERWQEAVDAYKEFMGQSSIAKFLNQRTWVRERISTITLQLRAAEAKETREKEMKRGASGG